MQFSSALTLFIAHRLLSSFLRLCTFFKDSQYAISQKSLYLKIFFDLIYFLQGLSLQEFHLVHEPACADYKFHLLILYFKL